MSDNSNRDGQCWDDFTIASYKELLSIAKRTFQFVGFGETPLSGRSVFWRHDVDCSLNRALRLAEIESENDVRSTFFVNPHSTFYNVFEKSQLAIIKNILSLGHRIGLHFDAGFYDVRAESDLDRLVLAEARLLRECLGCEITAFSFHNPTQFLLGCDNESYGGLINCYSKSLKTPTSYSSDSNGYWRFQSLRATLESNTSAQLQVLTHPEWWQESPLPPRERIFRCVDGRAQRTLRDYDDALRADSRENYGCLTTEFEFLKKEFGPRAQYLDQRWMRREFTSVFLDAWRLWDERLIKWCRITLRKKLTASSAEIGMLFIGGNGVSPQKVIEILFQTEWEEIFGMPEREFATWRQIRTNSNYGIQRYSEEIFENGIGFLVSGIKKQKEFMAQCASNKNELPIDKIPIYRGSFAEWALKNNLAIEFYKKYDRLNAEPKK